IRAWTPNRNGASATGIGVAAIAAADAVALLTIVRASLVLASTSTLWAAENAARRASGTEARVRFTRLVNPNASVPVYSSSSAATATADPPTIGRFRSLRWWRKVTVLGSRP